jgi:hypothetical protein
MPLHLRRSHKIIVIDLFPGVPLAGFFGDTFRRTISVNRRTTGLLGLRVQLLPTCSSDGGKNNGRGYALTLSWFQKIRAITPSINTYRKFVLPESVLSSVSYRSPPEYGVSSEVRISGSDCFVVL